MAPSHEALAPRSISTLDSVHQLLGMLSARNHSDEVLTCVRQLPAREATFRPMPEWVRDELHIVRRALQSCILIRPPPPSLCTMERMLSWLHLPRRARLFAITFRY